MPEENSNQNNTQKMLSDAEVQRRRNVANNANNVRLAAAVASNTNNPYAKAAGTAVKVADKLSDGKASEKLGKALDSYMKTQGLKGKMMQAALNKMSENGTSNRIAAATNKKNGAPSVHKKGILTGNNVEESSSKIRETEDHTDGGSASFSFSSKIVKYGVFGSAVFFLLLIPICLFTSATNIYIKSIGLGSADSVSFEDAESKINKKQKDTGELEEGVTKDDLSFDIFIEDKTSLRTKKLESSNLIKIAKTTYLKRKYTEADLSRLEEFYPDVVKLSKNNNENMIYDFFFKMYNLYTTYKDTYNVHLDLPLLMSTLMIQSEDMYIVFSSNLSEEDTAKIARKKPIKEFDYYYDWTTSDYKISKDNSEHDMELLAQNMISKQVKEKCEDSSGKVVKEKILKDGQIGTQSLFCNEGQTYETEELGYVKDDEKYREFLKQFLEKKYYLTGEHDITASNGDNDSNNDDVSNTSVCALTVIGDKYYKTVSPATKECNVPGFSDNPWKLEPKFYRNVMALIADAKSVGCDAAIISGHRSYEKQAYFYDCFVTKKCNSGNMAAKPGTSNHEYGIAADLKYMPKSQSCLNYYHTNAKKYGLEFPLLYHPTHPEDWHIEPIDIIKGKP